MARTGRRYPSHIIIAPRQVLAVTVGQVVTPRPPQLPVSLVCSSSERRHVHGSGVVQSRWPGYQWAGLAPVTPLVEPHVQAPVAPGEERRHVRGAVIAPAVQAAAAPNPPKPKQVVQASVSQPLDRRRGVVIAPPVQVAASVTPSSVQKGNTFDGGSNGTIISTVNSGGVSGDAFDTVIGSPTFSSAQFHSGTLSFAPAVSADNEVRWTDAGALGGGHFTTLYLRAYLYIQASPSANTVIMGGKNDAGTTIWRVALTTAGKVTININGAAAVTSTNALTQNGWTRLEAQFVIGGGTASTQAELFNSAESTTPTETINTSAADAVSNYLGSVLYGPTAVAGFTSPPFFDDVAVSSVTWIGPAPPPTPPRPVVQSVSTELRQHINGSVTAPPPQLAAAAAGSALVAPTPKQVVVDQAAFQPKRQQHPARIVQPAVQRAASAAPAAPATPPLPKQVVVARAAFQPKRQQHGGHVVEPSVQLAAAVAPPPPTVTPPRTVFIVQAAQQPRQHRRGVVTAPRPVQGVTTRPIVSVVTARPPSVQTRRHGCITAPRRITAPIAPPRPVLVHPLAPPRRRGGSVVSSHGRFVQTGGATTLITTPLTGYVSVGDRGIVTTGDTAQPPAGDTGTVKTGNTGFPRI